MAIPRKQLSQCPIERCVSVLGGRWKTMILYQLVQQPRGFGELRRLLVDCPERVLTRQLRELERDCVIERRSLGGKPPKVEYALSPLGQGLRPVFDALWGWGESHRTQVAMPTTPPRPISTPSTPAKPVARRTRPAAARR